jgi:hypothetical protein
MTLMIVLLALYNAGGMLSLIPAIGETRSVTFIGISNYMALTAAFFAAVVAKEPKGRMATIRSAYVASGVFASALAVLGYFDVLGLSQYFTLYGDLRAAGPFKDPNVLAPFLAPPVIFLMQDVLLVRGAGSWRRLPMMLVMMLAILLTFSRGGWGVLVLSSVALVALTFATTSSARLRARIVIVGFGCALLAALALAIAMSISSIGAMFFERASLNQPYDVGELGRFGSQLRSIPMLLELPLGFGPLRFDEFFSGCAAQCLYQRLLRLRLARGRQLPCVRADDDRRRIPHRLPKIAGAERSGRPLVVPPSATPSRRPDRYGHWRHLFMLFGCLYGLAAAVAIEARRQSRSRAQSAFHAQAAAR